MRILYVNTPVYDFLTAAIIEGLNELASQMPIQLVTTRRSNYARASQVWTRQKIYKARHSFDLFILGTNDDVDEELYWDVANPDHAICIDGSDYPTFMHPAEKFRLYFKRELYESPIGNIRPCTFAIERRWWRPLSQNPAFFLAACFGPKTGDRARVIEFLEASKCCDVTIGPIKPTIWNSLEGVWRGQCSFSVWKKTPFAVGHNYRYYSTLQKSLMALSVPGLGLDTGRYWEILGSGALLVSQTNSLQILNRLVHGEHCFTFNSLDELAAILQRARLDKNHVRVIRQQARDLCLRYHSTLARARYVIEEFRRTVVC